MAKSSKRSNQTFVNPYNFIPLQSECSRGIDYVNNKSSNAHSELHTGWIDCDLKTLTPIFIPNTSDSMSDIFDQKTKNGEKIKSYDFFSYTNLEGTQANPAPPIPVIPGSEIRGAIRSAFEALTNSCLSTIDQKRVLYKRTTKSAIGCGILNHDENTGKWVVWECKKYGVSTRKTNGDPNDFSSIVNKLYDGQKVYVKSSGRKYQNRPLFDVVDDIKDVPTPGYKEGWFHKGEKFGNTDKKHHEYVFVLDDSKKKQSFDVPTEAVDCLLKNLKLYADPKINTHKKSGHHNGYENIANDLEKKVHELKINDLDGLPVDYSVHKVFPVYYTKHEGSNGQDYYYLSPAQIGREVFYNTIEKILKKNGNYEPCTDRTNLCSACALFGTASDKNATASRVRFTDAIIPESEKMSDNSGYFEGVKRLPELASPKPSAVEFYLKRPGDNGRDKVAVWNYDYAVIWKNEKRYMPNYNPVLRGRKFYWHQKIDQSPEIPDILNPVSNAITNKNSLTTAITKNNDGETFRDKYSKASERNVAVRPLKKGIDFKFRVYFKNLTEKELKQMIWVLGIGGKEENAHKIGMGKPLGLGSVKITISDVKLRTIGISEETIKYEINSRNDIIQQTRGEKQVSKILGCNENTIEDFLNMTDFEKAPADVKYPCNEGSGKTYEWFVANKIEEKTGGTGTDPFIRQELPPISSKPELKKYRY